MRILSFFLFLFITVQLSAQSWEPVNGTKDSRNHYTAFTNAQIYLGNGKWATNETLLIKNDRIVAIGGEVVIPKNTVIYDLKGKFIYPSFIDLYAQFGIEEYKNETSGRKPQLNSKKKGPYYWNETIKPEVKALDQFSYDEKSAEKYRKMGFGSLLTHQHDGVMRGTSALVALHENEDKWMILAEASAQYSFFKGKSKQTYPSSLMGTMALIRQAHFDAKWYEENPKEREFNYSLAAIQKQQRLPKIIKVGSTLSALRADSLGDELGIQFIIKSEGEEYQRINAIRNTKAPLIVPVNFPKPYDVSDPFDALQLSLAKMKAWEKADENLVHLQQAKVPFSITAEGLENEKAFFENMKRSLQKGLSHDDALRALTENPAKLIGADSLLGSLEKGKLANFIITSDTLFANKTILYANWVRGKEYLIKNPNLIDIRGLYSLNIQGVVQFDLKVSGELEKLKAEIAEKGKTDFQKVNLQLQGNRISLAFHFEEELYRLSGSVSDKQSRIWSGKSTYNGEWYEWGAIRKGDIEKSDSSKNKADSSQTNTLAQVNYPNMAFGWDSLPNKAEPIVFRNATVWTNEKEGVVKNYDVLINKGEILMLGHKINLELMYPKLADQVKEIDASDLHLTSGIIDEHSHIAISRGVNESGQAVTSEVSIGDVVNSDDINIYRQLSGGVTASQLLHGSANPIGGRSAIIKLRWGKTPAEMLIKDADGFIKFALGENVKQSNWGDEKKIRFPQTRMGVEQVFYDAFLRAKEYQAEWEIYNAKNRRQKKRTSAPRKDLELEVLAEILDSNRFITCHSYMQSEINMLMHVADSMGFTVNTFTHILEGYKVADKMREHGAAGSTFSDWWAYKFEVNDAIPYNGAIMHNQGVLTAFNSDDAEMGRRLNQEAAKAVKYGGLSEEEAWKFVTLNPAKMLHLDERMGSIKAGKDADLVLWSGHPLSIYTKAKQTYIDGIPYYDEERDMKMRKAVQKERERIISLMLAEKKKGKETQQVKEEKQKLYECDTVEE
jgi:imidazolonepropionase-like amidohydrolase